MIILASIGMLLAHVAGQQHMGRRTSRSAFNITAQAAPFDTPECQRAIAEMPLDRWSTFASREQETLRFGNEFMDMQVTPPATDKSKNVIYMRNQKVGSFLICNKIGSLLSPAGVENPTCNPTREKSMVDHSHRVHAMNSSIVFTYVRDPIQAALSAYLEISHRGPPPGNLRHFWKMPCKTPEQSHARFLRYLEVVEQGEPLSEDAFHGYPQVLKVNHVLPRLMDSRRYTFDAIGRLEDFESNWMELREMLGIGGSPTAGALGQFHHSRRQDKCASVDLKDPVLVRKLCSMYAADFVCFGYPLPAVCSTVHV